MTTAFLTIALVCCTALASPSLAAAPVRDDIAQRALACMACHGQQDGARPVFFPRIAGKPSGYLYNQLVNFRDGRRRYPAMNYLVAHLSDAYLLELADYFAALQLPYPPLPPASSAATDVERGRQLVTRGDPGRKIPACIACHGDGMTGAGPAIPGLLGLPRDYINAQFGAWKIGARRAAEPDCMREVSRQLSSQDIEAVAAWLSAQAVPPRAAAQAIPAPALPLPCGSAH